MDKSLALAEELKQRFFASLENEVRQLTERFPHIHPKATSFFGRTQTQVLALECRFLEAPDAEPDLLALCITGEKLGTTPRIQADISWGDPSGFVEEEVFDSPAELNRESLLTIEENLPQLYTRLEELIRRGKPTNLGS